LPAFGVPRSNASIMWRVCSKVTLGGNGGSFPSTTASTRTGPVVSSAAHVEEARRPGSIGAGIRGDDGVIVQQPVQLEGDDLRFHGRVRQAALFGQPVAPGLHPLLRRLKEGPAVARLKARRERAQDFCGVADQSALNGVAQADARTVRVDLHRTRLPGLWIEFDIRKRTTDDQERVASA
jgi:hypothetical protein